jgi:polyvinyl alcohol dehydrogenase (cytochrome)
MVKAMFLMCATVIVGLAAIGPTSAQTVADLRLFGQNCTSCHGNPKVPKAADGLQLRRMTAEAVYAAITTGQTHAGLNALKDEEQRVIAGYLGGRKVDAVHLTDAKLMPNQCTTNATIDSLSGTPLWNGWSPDLSNARMQPAKAAGLSVDDVPKLKLKWAFGFPAAELVWGQPTIAAGRVYVGVDTGAVYSLDAASGCVHWSFQADAGVRTAITINPIKGQGAAKYALYFGDTKGNVYAVDALSGKRVWKKTVEDQPVARITGSPVLYQDRLYVPSRELSFESTH